MASGGAGTPSGGAPMGGPMMFLRVENTIILEYLRKRLLDPDATIPEVPRDDRFGDLDGVNFRVEVPEDALHLIRVSAWAPNFRDLQSIGVDEYLASVYGPLLVAPRDGAAVTLQIDASTPLPNAAEVVQKVSALRRHIIGWPLTRAVRALANQAAGGAGALTPFVDKNRPAEPIYVLPRADRVIAIFALEFAESTERAIARVIAQEFSETQRSVSGGPACSWAEAGVGSIPMELRALPDVVRQGPAFVGYLSMTLFPTHVNSEAKRDLVVSQLCQFRSYLSYHVKAAKSYLHARMRARGDELQKVLNRAIPEDPFADKEKKLASGKTFVRKA